MLIQRLAWCVRRCAGAAAAFPKEGNKNGKEIKTEVSLPRGPPRVPRVCSDPETQSLAPVSGRGGRKLLEPRRLSVPVSKETATCHAAGPCPESSRATSLTVETGTRSAEPSSSVLAGSPSTDPATAQTSGPREPGGQAASGTRPLGPGSTLRSSAERWEREGGRRRCEVSLTATGRERPA